MSDAHGLRSNPGYDFRRAVGCFHRIDPNDESQPIAPYFLPILGVISACCAIEGYVNTAGAQVLPDWQSYAREALRDRIKAVYAHLDQPLDLGSGRWQDVTQLFRARNELVHPEYEHRYGSRASTKTVFERIGAEFPTGRSIELVDFVRQALRDDAGVREHWHIRSINMEIPDWLDLPGD